MFSQENRYSRDGTRIPTNYYPDGDPELVRLERATSSALQKSDNIKNVIINEDELDDAEFQWYTSNDYKRFRDFVRLTNSLVSKEVNQAFSFLDPSTEFGDIESAEVVINSYNEAKDNIFANQITRLQEYIESEPFERLVASIGQKVRSHLKILTRIAIYLRWLDFQTNIYKEKLFLVKCCMMKLKHKWVKYLMKP